MPELPIQRAWPCVAAFLQRKCSCGGSGGVSGECGGCEAQRQFGSALQPKLRVSAPNDPYEQQADRLADAVMAIPSSNWGPPAPGEGPYGPRGGGPPIYRRVTPLIQRQAAPPELAIDEEEEEAIQTRRAGHAGHLQRQAVPEEDEEEETVQTRRARASGTPTRPERSDFHGELDAERSSGDPMDVPIRSFMESRFGVDFGRVRVHRSQRAASLARAVHAQAFTLGDHIYFGSGYYQPASATGRNLLAHELVHTIQQTGSKVGRRRDHGEAAASSSSPPPRLRVGDLPTHAVPSIQRQADTFVPPILPHGKVVHAEILPELGKVNKLFTEVKIPGAKELVRGEEQAGTADLYKVEPSDRPAATGENPPEETTIAVIMLEGKPSFLGSDRKLLKDGNKFPHKKKGAPRGVEKDQLCDGKDVDVCRLDRAPKKILLGDLKPPPGVEIFLGKGQISDYQHGIELTKNSLNQFIKDNRDRADPKDTFWNPTTDVLGDINPGIYDYNATGSKSKEDSLRLRTDPDRYKIPGLKGRLIVYKEAPGIFVYEWIPTKYPDAYGETPKQIAARERIDRLIAQLKTPPANPGANVPGKALPGRPARVPAAEPARALEGGVLQRRPKFDPVTWQTDFKSWKETEATAFLGTDEVGVLPTGKAKVPESEEAKTARLAAALVSVKQRTGLDMKLPASADKLGTAYRRIRLWARWGSVFGRIRSALGGLFVKMSSLFEKAKDKFAEKFAEYRKGRSGQAPSGDRILASIVKSALRVGINFFKAMVSRIIKNLKASLAKAAKVLIGAFFGADNLEKLENAQANVEELANTAEAEVKASIEERIKPIVEPYEEIFEGIGKIKEWLGDVKRFVDTVKWGLRVVQCVTPPGWGCLKLIIGPLNEYLASKVTASCWFQLNYIKPVLARVELFKSLPDKVSGAILGELKNMARALPFPDATIEEAFKVVPVSTNVTQGELECDDKAVTPAQRAMNRLAKPGKYDPKQIQRLIDLFEASGLSENREMTLDDVKVLDRLLQKMKVRELTEEQLTEAIGNLKRGAGSGLKDVDDLLKRLGGGSGSGSTGGPGPKSVPFEKARYSGKTGGPTSRSAVAVGNASASHEVRQEQRLDLEGLVDDQVVIVVTGVPAVVWSVSDKVENGVGVREIIYKITESVAFRHGVPGVSDFGITAGTEMPATVERTQ